LGGEQIAARLLDAASLEYRFSIRDQALLLPDLTAAMIELIDATTHDPLIGFGSHTGSGVFIDSGCVTLTPLGGERL
jgi:hypothetical protein